MIERIKDETYLQFIRQQRCAVPVCRQIPDAHHLDSRGAGGSDYSAVPLCRQCHSELHSIGHFQFENKWGIDLWKEAWALTLEYFKKEKKGIKLTLPNPPLVNRRTRVALRGGRAFVHTTREDKEFIGQVGRLLMASKIKPYRGMVGMEITWYRRARRGDVDAPIKSVLDSLQGGIYQDDKQVSDLRVIRRDDKENPRIEVEAWEIK